VCLTLSSLILHKQSAGHDSARPDPSLFSGPIPSRRPSESAGPTPSQLRRSSPIQPRDKPCAEPISVCFGDQRPSLPYVPATVATCRLLHYPKGVRDGDWAIPRRRRRGRRRRRPAAPPGAAVRCGFDSRGRPRGVLWRAYARSAREDVPVLASAGRLGFEPEGSEPAAVEKASE
jgi:hypothetical protein